MTGAHLPQTAVPPRLLGDPLKPVGIFAATRWELNAVKRALTMEDERVVDGIRCLIGRRGTRSSWLIRTGVGMERAGRIGHAVTSVTPFSVVISTGFACALAPAGIGDLLIGTDVVCRSQATRDRAPVDCATTYRLAALQAARDAGIVAKAGRFVTVPEVLWRAQQKTDVAAETGGLGLDMESGALAEVADKTGIPFAIVRTVSDLVDETLPLDFNLFLRPTGWPRGALACLANPGSVAGLWRLRSQSAQAARQLTRFYERFLDSLQTAAEV